MKGVELSRFLEDYRTHLQQLGNSGKTMVGKDENDERVTTLNCLGQVSDWEITFEFRLQ